MNNIEKKILTHFRQLDVAQQQTVLDFLMFLSSRPTEPTVAEIQQPLEMLRPAEESVIKAVKRLRATYPMLEPTKLLHETSSQLTRHVIHGVPTAEVIDELEQVFKRHYEAYIAAQSKPGDL